MNLQKINQYFFIVAAIITIFDGVFDLSPEMTNLKFIVLILSGLVVGVLRNRNDDRFFYSGAVLAVTAFIILELLKSHMAVSGLGLMIVDFVVFVASALFILALERVFGELTTSDEHGLDDEINDLKQLRRFASQEVETQTFERIWGTVILVAVALTFISLLTQLFFQPGPFMTIFYYVDAFITIVFIADLVVLYLQSSGFKNFVRRNVVDIIAAIPAAGVLRVLKLVRVFRILKIMKGGAKLGQAVKLYKTVKFFSEDSYFNKIEEQASNSTKNGSKKKTSKRTTTKKRASKKKTASTKKRTASRNKKALSTSRPK
ncbi:MAG: ion transporter [Candidatus Woesearchaeota archaeon]